MHKLCNKRGSQVTGENGQILVLGVWESICSGMLF